MHKAASVCFLVLSLENSATVILIGKKPTVQGGSPFFYHFSLVFQWMLFGVYSIMLRMQEQTIQFGSLCKDGQTNICRHGNEIQHLFSASDLSPPPACHTSLRTANLTTIASSFQSSKFYNISFLLCCNKSDTVHVLINKADGEAFPCPNSDDVIQVHFFPLILSKK